VSDGSLNPDDLLRRSPVYRELAAAGASFVEANGGAIAEGFGPNIDAEIAVAKRLALADLSLLPHFGFKGRETVDWLRSQGVDVGDQDNLAYRQMDGALAAKLAPREVLLVSDVAGSSDVCHRLADTASIDEEIEAFPVPRGDGYFWFLVSGAHAGAMFAKICGVDLRPEKIPQLEIAQTSVARMNVVIIRDNLGDTPAYHVLGDVASASYLWTCLRDAMEEFGGDLIGHRAVRNLAGL
jgi:sarcosine oxidase subunit gamma